MSSAIGSAGLIMLGWHIADYLNTNGYKPKRGVKWYAMSVKNMIDRIYS